MYRLRARAWATRNRRPAEAPSRKPARSSSTYHRYGSLVSVQDKESSFFDGIDTSLTGIASLAPGGKADFLPAGFTESKWTGGRRYRRLFGRLIPRRSRRSWPMAGRKPKP